MRSRPLPVIWWCLPRFRERAHNPQPSVLVAAMDIIKFGHGVQAVHKTALGVLYWEISDGQHAVRVTDGNAIRFAEALARSVHVNIVDQNRTVRELCSTADGEKMLELFGFDARQLVFGVLPKKP